MRQFSKALLAVMTAGSYVACAPTEFKQEPVTSCVGPTCVTIDKDKPIKQKIRANGGLVDILIVNDNSGSMSFEQNKMAERFSSFIQALDLRFIDYRIGIITTDIQNNNSNSVRYNPARAINQNGSLQNGKLITFGNSQAFITNNTANKEALFATAISRGAPSLETGVCEAFLKANSNANTSSSVYQQGLRDSCPSGDERGIYAANLFVNDNPSSFIRPNAHLAIVFLADEDVSSSLYYQSPSYKLVSEDLPQTLVNNVYQKYPSKGLSVHSIIVRPGTLIGGKTPIVAADEISRVIGNSNQIDSAKSPANLFNEGDYSCLGQQSNQINAGLPTAVKGSYGYLYALATRMTNGVEGDICASDYGSQLYNIGFNIAERTREVTLFCASPKDLKVTYSPSASLTYTISGTKLTFSADLPPGTEATLEYFCSPQ
ncbi:MAG: hypothetical protein LW875_02790 [Proteobacteria bacterium]|jgi:hypothetical protein|nr:hypothetical protein [Pseudomonadota bacterium]